MPRTPTERPITESMTVVLRLQRQLDMSSHLTAPRKKRVREHLGAVLLELQETASSMPVPRVTKR